MEPRKRRPKVEAKKRGPQAGAAYHPLVKAVRQDTALAALLAGATISEAAAKAQASRNTVARWLKDPAVIARLNERREELWRVMGDHLLNLASEAVAELAKLIHDKDSRVKVSAIAKVLATLTALRRKSSGAGSGQIPAEPVDQRHQLLTVQPGQGAPPSSAVSPSSEPVQLPAPQTPANSGGGAPLDEWSFARPD